MQESIDGGLFDSLSSRVEYVLRVLFGESEVEGRVFIRDGIHDFFLVNLCNESRIEQILSDSEHEFLLFFYKGSFADRLQVAQSLLEVLFKHISYLSIDLFFDLFCVVVFEKGLEFAFSLLLIDLDTGEILRESLQFVDL